VPASCWADAAISCAEALVCCVEAETCSEDALDSSATVRGICNQNGQGGQTGGQNGQAGRFGGRGFGGQTVTAVSADSITVEGPNGPATIKLDADTMINKSSGASVSDIKKGDSVMVAGAFGPGGNTQGGAARSITILPQSAGN